MSHNCITCDYDIYNHSVVDAILCDLYNYHIPSFFELSINYMKLKDKL